MSPREPAHASEHTPAWPIYRRLLGYAARHWPVALVAVLGMIVDAACITAFAKLIKPLLDNLFVDKDPYTIFWMPVWIVAIFLLRGVAAFVTSYGTAYVGRNVVQQLRTEMFAAYLRMPASFFAGEPSGQQISRITFTTEQVANAASNAVKVAVIDGLTVIGLVGVMLY